MTKSPFIVYILPIILSVSLGALVMAEALKDPERELNMWQFEEPTNSKQQDQLSIIGLEKNYSTADQIQFEIKVNDSNFDCGNLYITIYEVSNIGDDQVITQSGYLDQCYIKDKQNLPIDDKYSENISQSGNYKIIIDVYDKKHKQTLSYTDTFIVN